MENQKLISQKNQSELSLKQSQRGKIIHLGGSNLPKKKILKTQSLPSDSQAQFNFKFSETNPFFHLHKALYSQQPKTVTSNKTFQSVISQIHEMKQICQKILRYDSSSDEQCHKTLIMDLQNLQTRRVNMDQTNQEKKFSSQQSIKQHIQIEKWKKGDCMYQKCDQINLVLKKDINKLTQLTCQSEKLAHNLQEQKKQKSIAKNENDKLRKEIADLDRMKCEAIDSLKSKIDQLKKGKLNQNKETSHQSNLLVQVGRKPLEVVYKQNMIPKVVRQGTKTQQANEKDISQSRLSRVVYL